MPIRAAIFLVCLLPLLIPSGDAAEFDSDASANYSFNPLQVHRDPFAPPEQDKYKMINDLLLFDTNEIKLVGIVTGFGSPQAMFVLPNGKTHIVRTGDAIGRRKGVIKHITTSEVIVRESFVDFRGRKKTFLNQIVLTQ